jgi:uncharacterized protein (DUF2267 family)
MTMSNTGLEIFDTTIQETNHWLKLVMKELGTDDRHIAFAALRAGLHALRDRIGAVNAVHLGAQLPMLLRGAYYEGWRPAIEQSRERHVEAFLNHVRANLPQTSGIGAEAVARATFAALAACIDTGEVQKVLGVLPREMGQLWPDDWEDYRGSRMQ